MLYALFCSTRGRHQAPAASTSMYTSTLCRSPEWYRLALSCAPGTHLLPFLCFPQVLQDATLELAAGQCCIITGVCACPVCLAARQCCLAAGECCMT
jgi:hypothetical protein